MYSFRERSNLQRIWFQDLRLRMNLRSRNQASSCDKFFFFLSLISRNFGDRLSSNFHRFVILCICRDTPSDRTGLEQLPMVSRVFKMILLLSDGIFWDGILHEQSFSYTSILLSLFWYYTILGGFHKGSPKLGIPLWSRPPGCHGRTV